jgi:hypothetical protein
VSNVSPSDGGYSYYQRNIDDLEDDIREDAKSREEKRQERLEAQAKRHEEELNRLEAKYAEELARVRDDSNERDMRTKQNARDEISEAKQQTYDRYGKLYEQTQNDRQDAQKAIEATRQEYETARARDKVNNERSNEQANRDQMRRSEDDAREMRNSHALESAQLRKQIQDLEDVDRQTLHGYNEGKAAAIREYENDVRDRQKINDDATTAELNNYREKSRAMNRYYNELNDRNLKNQGMEMTQLLNKQTEEAHQDRRQLEETFQLDRKQNELHQKNEREYMNRVLEQRADQAAEDRQHALDVQGQTYGEAYDNLSKQSAAREASLQASLQEAHTSADPSVISPAAEQAVRDATGKQYQKTMDADDKRKRGEIDSLRQNFHDRYNDLLADKRQTETRMAMNQSLQRHEDQAAYLDSVVELTNDRDESIRNKEAEHQRASDALTHDHARVLDQQRREYDDIVQNLKNDASDRLTAQRQESAFNAKMAQKAFSSRQNELIRDYEKKLADQKDQYESELGDVKSELATTQRESERRTAHALEEQSKGYEQRIAQLEFQNKERERLVSQNYQDELEKVKRSNALLIQKKS